MSARIEFRAAVVESFAVGLRGRCHWKNARDANRGSEQGGVESTGTFDLRGSPESNKRGGHETTQTNLREYRINTALTRRLPYSLDNQN